MDLLQAQPGRGGRHEAFKTITIINGSSSSNSRARRRRGRRRRVVVIGVVVVVAAIAAAVGVVVAAAAVVHSRRRTNSATASLDTGAPTGGLLLLRLISWQVPDGAHEVRLRCLNFGDLGPERTNV